MREIKFRGIYKGNFVFGNLIIATIDCRKFVEIEQSDSNDFQKWEVDENTVGQFTGLKDKNGKDIYERDIVKTILGNICEIKWDEVSEINGIDYYQYTGFCYHNIKQNRNFHLDSAHTVSIIGNTHENPELLNP